VHGAAAVDNSLAVPQTVRYRIIIGSGNSTSRYKQKEFKTGTQIDIYTLVFIGSSIIHNLGCLQVGVTAENIAFNILELVF